MGSLEEAVLRSDHSAMKAAIESGEDIDNMWSGMTPLISALFRGDVEAVRLLLAGADPNLYSTLDGPPLACRRRVRVS